MSIEVAGHQLDLAAAVVSEIRAQMGRLDINRSELARRLGVDDTWVGKRLNGKTEIGVSDLNRICSALDVKVSRLVDRAERQGDSIYPERSLRDTQPYAAQPAMPAPVVSGRIAHPDHPVLAGAVRLPLDRRTAPIHR